MQDILYILIAALQKALDKTKTSSTLRNEKGNVRIAKYPDR